MHFDSLALLKCTFYGGIQADASTHCSPPAMCAGVMEISLHRFDVLQTGATAQDSLKVCSEQSVITVRVQ